MGEDWFKFNIAVLSGLSLQTVQYNIQRPKQNEKKKKNIVP